MNDLLALERSQTSFVKERTSPGLNWEESLKKGESYSAYILEGTPIKNKMHLISIGYKLAASIISTVTPQKVTLRLDPTENYATACKQIAISTEVVEDKQLFDYEKIDVLLGEAVHEASHTEETDFELLSYPGSAQGQIKHTICNILEDERIEMITTGKHPGYGRFLEKTKYYYFDKRYLKQVTDHAKMSKGQKLFNLFFALVRYPKYIIEQDLITFSKEVEKIKKALTPYPATNEDIKLAVEKVYAILKSHHIQCPPPPTVPLEQKGEAGEKKLEAKGAVMGKGSLEEDLGEMAKIIGEILDSTLDNKSRKQVQTAKVVLSNRNETRLLEGRLEKGAEDKSFFSKASEDQLTYAQAKGEVAPYASALATILSQGYRSHEITHRSLRNGVLDTGKLVEGYQRIDTIYQRKERIESKPLDIALLIDLSGSLREDGKIEQARKCAVLFKESLQKVKGINTFIYGHTADRNGEGSTDITTYLEGKYRPAYALGSVKAGGNNRDGVAIEETAKRIRKYSANPCILFVLSDGQPSAHDYYGPSAITHTRDSVRRAEKLGFQIIQIAIEPEIPSDQMFSHYVTLTNLSTLPKDLGVVLRKTINQMRS